MHRFLSTITISLLSLSLFAQSRQEGVERYMHSIDTLLTSKRVYQSLYISPEQMVVDVEDINRWAADMQKSQFSKSGLDVSVGYDYRFCDYDKIDDSYEGGSIIAYKNRFFISLKWSILQSGLIGRDNFRQRVDILSRTKSQEVVNSMIKPLVMESAEQQMVNLYAYYNVLIDAKAGLYSELIDMQDKLVADNSATVLSLSDLKIKRANVLRMHKSGVPSANTVIDLDSYLASQQLFDGNEYDSLLDSNNAIIQNRLEQELTLNEANNISYWKEVEVSPYARITNYLDEYRNNKNIGNLGVTATFPIFTNTKYKRKEVASRGKLLANEEQVMRKDISRQIAEKLQQLNENLAMLQLLTENSKYYKESCELAVEYYKNKTMTIQELSQRYIDNLDNNIEIYKLIIEREDIQLSLFELFYGV